MSDFIDRQAAIDLVKSRSYDLSEIEDEWAMVHDVEELPSSQPEPQWIPCSEKLPTGQTEVIASVHDDSGDTSFDYIASGWVTDDGEYWIVDGEINYCVVAWMPIPEPYKER